MEIDGLKVLKGEIEGFNIEEFLKPEFLDIVKNEFDDIKFIQIGMATGKNSVLYLAHNSPENLENNTLTIGVSKEDQMDQIFKAVKTFKNGD